MSLFRNLFGQRESYIPNDADRQLKKTLKQLEKKRKQHHQGENSLAEAKTLEEIGMLLFRNKYYDASRDRWKDALRIFQETNDRPSMAELYSNIGTAYRQEGNLRESARFYNKSLLLDRDFNQGAGELISLHNLGSVWVELSEYESAMEAYGEALDISRDSGLPEWEADTLYRLGFTYRLLYRQTEAFRFFESGLKVSENLRNLPLMTLNVFGLGSVYEDIGEYAQAQLCYEDALQGAENVEDKALTADILTRTAALKLHIGYLDEAREIARVTNELIPPDKPSYVRVEHDLVRADIYYARGMKENSISLVEQALELAQQLPNRRSYIQARMRQAIMEMDRSRFRSAMDLMNSLERGSETTHNDATNIERLLVWGRIHRGMNQDDDAQQVTETATNKAEETRIPRLIWASRHQLGRIFHHQQRFQLARNEFERAETIVNRTAMSLDQATRRIFLEHRERLSLYQDYILLLVKLGHKEQANRILSRVDSEILLKRINHFVNE